MANGKAYMVVRCPVNVGVELDLLADPAVFLSECCSFYADYFGHVFAQIVPERAH